MGTKIKTTFHGQQSARQLFFDLFDLPDTATSIDVQTMADTTGLSVQELAALFKRYGRLTFKAQVEPEPLSTAARTAFHFRYKVTVTAVDSRRRHVSGYMVQRNHVRLRQLKAGEYSVRYHVDIVTGNKAVATTDFSPASSFHITHS